MSLAPVYWKFISEHTPFLGIIHTAELNCCGNKFPLLVIACSWEEVQSKNEDLFLLVCHFSLTADAFYLFIFVSSYTLGGAFGTYYTTGPSTTPYRKDCKTLWRIGVQISSNTLSNYTKRKQGF